MTKKSNSVVLIPQDQFDELMDRIIRIENLILGDAKKEASEEWIKSEEARKMLGVSIKTWQNWRDARKLPFSQLGRTIWVKKSAINAFLEDNNVGGRA